MGRDRGGPAGTSAAPGRHYRRGLVHTGEEEGALGRDRRQDRQAKVAQVGDAQRSPCQRRGLQRPGALAGTTIREQRFPEAALTQVVADTDLQGGTGMRGRRPTTVGPPGGQGIRERDHGRVEQFHGRERASSGRATCSACTSTCTAAASRLSRKSVTAEVQRVVESLGVMLTPARAAAAASSGDAAAGLANQANTSACATGTGQFRAPLHKARPSGDLSAVVVTKMHSSPPVVLASSWEGSFWLLRALTCLACRRGLLR